MAALNAIFRALFDALLGPFSGLPALVTLLPISLVVTVFALLVFKWTSNQDALERVKEKIQAGIFEIRLFNDDMRAILRAQGSILVQVLKQFALMVVPLLWMLVPFAILIPQLQFHYGYEGLPLEQPVLFKVTLKGEADPSAPNPGFELDAPAGVRVETPAIWVPARNEVMWRVAPVTAGSYILEVRDGAGHAMTKTLVASDEVVRRSPVRVSGFWWQIAFPAEPPLPADGPFEEASLPYPDTEVSLFGWELQWLYVFLILTIVFGFALRGPMKVTF